MPATSIPYDPEWTNVRACLAGGQTFRWREVASGTWTGVDGGSWYEVRVLPNRLHVTSNQDPLGLARLLRLELDAEQIEAEIVARGPELAGRAAACRGLRVIAPEDPVEVLFSFICSANNHLKRIAPMVEKLAAYGTDLGDGRMQFPDPEVLAEVTEQELRNQGFGYRGASIPKAARLVTRRGGRSYLMELRQGTYRQSLPELMSLPGVGRKVADCVCLFGLRHGEAVPIDTHTWAQLTKLYAPEWAGKAVTESRYARVTDAFRERFGELAGWAQQYLFDVNRLKLDA